METVQIFKEYLSINTCNPPKSNVIPGKTEAVLDCRLLPDQEPAEFVAKLKQIIDDPRIKIDYIERSIKSIVSPYGRLPNNTWK
ncbi:MAG: peptidase dimerization domain-containing protein [Candidatus Aminicenantaceae bacterium]